MNGLTIKAEVSVNLTGREWEIFDAEIMLESSTNEYATLEDAEADYARCASELNEAASEALSCGDAHEAYRIFQKAQFKWQHWGAYDSEPSWKFEAMMQKIFDN
jgi:hypothetical protein